VLDYYPSYVGKIVYEIGKRLSSNGVYVKVAASNLACGSEDCKGNDDVIRLRATRIVVCDTPFVVYDWRDLRLLNKNLDFDIIHVHFLYKFLSLYIGLMKETRRVHVPLVTTSHGLTSGYPSGIVQATAKLLNELAKKLVITNSSIITTVSKVEFRHLAKFIPTNKLCYIPNGVDTSFFKADRNKRYKLRNKFGIDENDVLVLYFTRLRAAKGVLIFLKAMAEVIRKTNNVKFLMAGSGPLTSHVKKMEKKFSDRLHTLLGYIPERDLPYLYSASDVYALPSYVEGMPLSVMEAMACGKPVVVTRVGDVPFLVKNGVNGIVIPPGNADVLAKSIIYLAENPELRKLMGETNVRKMKEYDWNKIAKQYYTLYSGILNTNDYLNN